MLPSPRLDAASEVPLYRQLHAHFTELIRSGSLKKGERLPATRELAGALGLNRTTVSAAYELLESEGLISGQVGRGSFVAGSQVEVSAGLDWDELLAPLLATPPSPPSGRTGMISFASSRPAAELFPVDAFRVSCEEVMACAEFPAILQLGSPAGYEPLRQYLLETARREGVARVGDDLIVTSGCQQALDLAQRVLLRPRDAAGARVGLEDPIYPGVKNLFMETGAEISGIAVGPDGMDTAQLERVLARERLRLLVVSPNFQNPTGATLPLAARESIMRQTRQAGTVLIENDIYSELRYEGESLPTIKQMDDSGDTILLRSFSKIAFPGLRVGWAIGPRAVIARMIEAKQLSDLHTDQLAQAVLLRFVQSGRLETHQTHMLQTGAERLKAVLAACERYLPRETRYTRPQGGMNLWVRLPEPLDGADLLARAHEEGVSYLPGKFFAIHRQEPGALRLSFAGLVPEKIEQGLQILGRIFSGELERMRRQRAVEPAPVMV
jgi:2-aminoadipate transaminase